MMSTCVRIVRDLRNKGSLLPGKMRGPIIVLNRRGIIYSIHQGFSFYGIILILMRF